MIVDHLFSRQSYNLRMINVLLRDASPSIFCNALVRFNGFRRELDKNLVLAQNLTKVIILAQISNEFSSP